MIDLNFVRRTVDCVAGARASDVLDSPLRAAPVDASRFGIGAVLVSTVFVRFY